MNKQGVFISLEGPDGAGKTTQLHRIAQKANELGIETVCTREPGGTAISDAVREILLDPRFGEMTPLTEVFLYAAARAQLYREVIAPALSAGKLVLCDRFIDSSLAYQVFGGGIEWDFVLSINVKAVQERLPDRTFILDLPPDTGLSRRAGAAADRIEQKSLTYHNRVRQGFLEVAARFPERIAVVDGTPDADEVFRAIWNGVSPLIARTV
ncbi:MAG: dTMP kinase [Clostridiales bacterium]|jgi:dTMP kinase|nr:dTMP kinase [Clostridiales bacterium]